MYGPTKSCIFGVCFVFRLMGLLEKNMLLVRVMMPAIEYSFVIGIVDYAKSVLF